MASRFPPICRPSALFDDWVVKGFHIHVNGIESAVRPGHRRGMIVFKRFVRRDSGADVDAARRIAVKTCLSSKHVRAKRVKTPASARAYLNGYDGDFQELANGRKREFRRLEQALRAYVGK